MIEKLIFSRTGFGERAAAREQWSLVVMKQKPYSISFARHENCSGLKDHAQRWAECNNSHPMGVYRHTRANERSEAIMVSFILSVLILGPLAVAWATDEKKLSFLFLITLVICGVAGGCLIPVALKLWAKHRANMAIWHTYVKDLVRFIDALESVGLPALQSLQENEKNAKTWMHDAQTQVSAHEKSEERIWSSALLLQLRAFEQSCRPFGIESDLKEEEQPA